MLKNLNKIVPKIIVAISAWQLRLATPISSSDPIAIVHCYDTVYNKEAHSYLFSNGVAPATPMRSRIVY